MTKNRVCVIIIEGESFGMEADRIEDDSTANIYKVYLNSVLQGKFNKDDVQGYFWDTVSECTHDE